MTQATIFSLSSGQPPAGVAVIRISGSLTSNVLAAVAGSLPPARLASLRTIRKRNGEVLDQGLVLYFPAPNSFTGEDCAELQVHGSRAVVNAISETLRELGLRQAEAGEFARRAFEHGRLDLVEVEGLSDLVSAETEMQRKLALQTGMGALSAQYLGWAERLTYARAMIEAELDFADEEDAPESAADLIGTDLAVLMKEMSAASNSARSAEIIRNGFKVAIIGAPNAGKSSLLNAMAKREVAIVTDIAGTTRDVLTVELDMEGYLVRLYDTAGIRDADDVVEREGIKRAKDAARSADMILYLRDARSGLDVYEGFDVPYLNVETKADLYPNNTSDAVRISSVTGQGLDQIHQAIVDLARESWNVGSLAGKDRHQEHIALASKFIQDALDEPRLELKADALRAAGDELGRITGRVDVEDLLDVIFSKFCIGK
ncbi:tRNA uridine-5-carboxymethylaminomethyl(34) synthesis GTPase MnmE [Aliirhizobium smilacinae]|uniref:tRNA modification GTPase MnmE n=1 Tax=Aliirhizobium smilacinae TaxID=1395944 RepID=A0A5C4XDA8_9HYPH|nr:tRNA uridine-5-carboxymethylaminomethyl(34) synthesis GTPase MnmE [Rhizobium smilacinae]TNM60650.1 tRNA uridine-5-carboxymethylaminomethyl(34) synthesis GTPase MnmE [Rhizobium smilacinae]